MSDEIFIRVAADATDDDVLAAWRQVKPKPKKAEIEQTGSGWRVWAGGAVYVAYIFSDVPDAKKWAERICAVVNGDPDPHALDGWIDTEWQYDPVRSVTSGAGPHHRRWCETDEHTDCLPLFYRAADR